MIIRDFRQEDFNHGLLECINELGRPLVLSETRRRHTTMMRQRRNVRTFVVVSGVRTVLATASVFLYPTYLHDGSFAGHVEDVAVHPDYQRMGYGREIVEYCVAYCREKKCYKVVLNCSAANTAFYEKCGFKKMADDFMRIDL